MLPKPLVIRVDQLSQLDQQQGNRLSKGKLVLARRCYSELWFFSYGY